jgi:predicted phosphate transport protein (TIGR00153 family)
LRREIELTLYGKALLPESRGDLLGLLETYDQMPNMAQTVLFALRCQRVVMPANLMPSFESLVELNLKAYYAARKTVDELFHNPKVILHTTKEVDLRESESDRAERQLIGQIFDTDMDTGYKLLYKELVLLIGHISDRAELTADRVAIVAIKRQI